MAFDALITRLGASAVSLSTYAYVASYDGILQPAPMRGADLLVPSRMGQVWAAQQYDAYTFSVPLMLLGTSQSGMQDSLSGLKQLVESSRQSVVFSRKVPRAGGDLTTSCRSRVRVSEVGMVNGMITGRVALEVTNTDGCWYGAQVSDSASGFFDPVTNPGDAPTNRITLTFPSAGILSNTESGTGITVGAACTVNVQDRTTTGNLADLSHNGGDPFGNWFTLVPGTNQLSWSSGGSVTVAFSPTYQ